jgi:hypothetical protein
MTASLARRSRLALIRLTPPPITASATRAYIKSVSRQAWGAQHVDFILEQFASCPVLDQCLSSSVLSYIPSWRALMDSTDSR